MKIVVGNIEIKKTMEKRCKGYYDLIKKQTISSQLEFNFEEPKPDNKLKEELEKIDPFNITPIDALKVLYDLKEKSKNE